MQVYFGLNIHPSYSEIPATLNVTQASYPTPMKGYSQRGEKYISFPSHHGKCIITTFCIYLNSRLHCISCYPVALHSMHHNFQISFGNNDFENSVFPFSFFMYGHGVNSTIKLICFT